MGKGGGGGGNQPQTTTAYQTNLPEYAKPYVMNMLGAAQNQLFTTKPGVDGQPGEITGFRPYQPYSTDPTKYFAGPSSLQQQVYGEAAGMQTPGSFGAAQGLAGMAGLGAMGAGGQYQRMATDPNAISAYMSPFMQNVVDVQKAQAIRDYQMGIPALRRQASAAGAFGGSRQAIQEAEAQRSLLSNLANIQAQGTQNAFQQAQQAQQFGANLGLQGFGQGLQAASTLGQLGGAQQQADLARMGFQQQTGAAQQQYQQNIINQAIQDYATAQQYPMMQLSAMSSLLRGLPLQSATTQTYQAAPSVTSQLAGLGTAGVGAYGLGRATGIFKEGGQVKGYKYGGLIPPEKLRAMADGLTKDQLEAQLRDPTLDDIERQIFTAELREKSRGLGVVPAQNMENLAGGGIVAFAEGDLVDDEEDDDSTGVGYAGQDDDAELMDDILARGIPAGAYGRGLAAAAPTGQGIRPEARAPRGLDADTFVQKIMARESGGRRYDKEGKLLTSSKGAEGEMQVMPKTQRDPGFGVRPARDDSPDEIARVGRDYATMLLTRYEDPKVAAIAYNWGPGNTDKWLAQGADMSKLPKETQKYIRNLKAGGTVKHFFNGGSAFMEDIERFRKYAKEPGINEAIIGKIQGVRDYFTKPRVNMVDPTKPEGGAVAYVPGTDDTYDPELNKQSRGIAMVDENAAKQELDARAAYEKELAAEKERATAGSSKLEEMLLKREQNLEKQGAIDANLSLIMAGLGMAGGTSKNALENISKGAQLGLGTYMTGAKQRAAGENAILSGRLGLERLRGLQDIRQQQMTQNRQGALERGLGAYEQKARASALQILKANSMLPLDATPEQQAQMANELAVKNLANDPTYRRMYKELFGFDFNMPTSSGPATMNKEQLIAKAKAERERLGIK